MLTRMAKESGIETPTAEDLVRLDRKRKGRIAALELKERRTAKIVLLENLDQAERIALAVDVHGQSVAEFARAAGIEERRAQRILKLAPLAEEIRKRVRDGEAKHGDDYDCPSWKRFVPKPQARQEGAANPTPPSTPTPLPVFEAEPSGVSAEEAVEYNKTALLQIGRQA